MKKLQANQYYYLFVPGALSWVVSICCIFKEIHISGIGILFIVFYYALTIPKGIKCYDYYNAYIEHTQSPSVGSNKPIALRALMIICNLPLVLMVALLIPVLGAHLR